MGTAESHLFGIVHVKEGFFAAQKMRVTLTWMQARFVWTTWLIQCVICLKIIFHCLIIFLVIFFLFFALSQIKRRWDFSFYSIPIFQVMHTKTRTTRSEVKADWNILSSFIKNVINVNGLLWNIPKSIFIFKVRFL